ncbi:hypothetical protein IE53DRAFT_239592 [Violaceomyces palustris]|uniref:Uncharacterized protein n=1 Tax=Violaceomyces palustris TaxID=1673888 RepID=A0ACD0P8F8_9BASI|nr:hypothetical protein IE53DRAFT_239592 [Violaceomyces palustris]
MKDELSQENVDSINSAILFYSFWLGALVWDCVCSLPFDLKLLTLLCRRGDRFDPSRFLNRLSYFTTRYLGIVALVMATLYWKEPQYDEEVCRVWPRLWEALLVASYVGALIILTLRTLSLYAGSSRSDRLAWYVVLFSLSNVTAWALTLPFAVKGHRIQGSSTVCIYHQYKGYTFVDAFLLSAFAFTTLILTLTLVKVSYLFGGGRSSDPSFKSYRRPAHLVSRLVGSLKGTKVVPTRRSKAKVTTCRTGDRVGHTRGGRKTAREGRGSKTPTEFGNRRETCTKLAIDMIFQGLYSFAMIELLMLILISIWFLPSARRGATKAMVSISFGAMIAASASSVFRETFRASTAMSSALVRVEEGEEKEEAAMKRSDELRSSAMETESAIMVQVGSQRRRYMKNHRDEGFGAHGWTFPHPSPRRPCYSSPSSTDTTTTTNNTITSFSDRAVKKPAVVLTDREDKVQVWGNDGDSKVERPGRDTPGGPSGPSSGLGGGSGGGGGHPERTCGLCQTLDPSQRELCNSTNSKKAIFAARGEDGEGKGDRMGPGEGSGGDNDDGGWKPLATSSTNDSSKAHSIRFKDSNEGGVTVAPSRWAELVSHVQDVKGWIKGWAWTTTTTTTGLRSRQGSLKGRHLVRSSSTGGTNKVRITESVEERVGRRRCSVMATVVVVRGRGVVRAISSDGGRWKKAVVVTLMFVWDRKIGSRWSRGGGGPGSS